MSAMGKAVSCGGGKQAGTEACKAAAIPSPPQIETYVLSEDPEMMILENFISHEEARHLLHISEGRWARSTITKGKASELLDANGFVELTEEAEDDDRTSDSVVLEFGESVVVERLLVRAAAVAECPLSHVEKPVLVRYQPGQRFGVHHDGSVRPTTIFVYCNDVPAGGETHFPELGLKIHPKACSAVQWKNTLQDGAADTRLVHEALPPSAGVKYGINLFVNREPQRKASHVRVVPSHAGA